MKRFVTILLSALFVLTFVAGCVTPRVVEQTPAGPASSGGKNLCLLDSEECPARKMTIIELIDGLRQELAKGEAVYTPAELRKLGNKLREYEFMYDRLMYGDND
ncbi:hypothetical protein [Geobacter sp.]|uniref:hypothetical protein n=1 Tax=Geobacter sp. TaxID=46610 RepID=UPI0027B97679|nr:hypothetical protein [Geobacter sp.]